MVDADDIHEFLQPVTLKKLVRKLFLLMNTTRLFILLMYTVTTQSTHADEFLQREQCHPQIPILSSTQLLHNLRCLDNR